MSTIPASGNSKTCLGPVFTTIYKFGSIQFSDTLMSDGYFHICPTKESNLNVSEISIDPSLELNVSAPNTDKLNRQHQQCTVFRSFNPVRPDTRIACPICTVISSRARLDIVV